MEVEGGLDFDGHGGYQDFDSSKLGLIYYLR